MTERKFSAVCIDDEVMDLKLNERVLRKSGAFDLIRCYPSAEAALDDLRAEMQARQGCDPDDPAPQTDVIFLDVNMPRMNGFEFLEAAHRQLGPGFAGCVVIMLTTSLHPRDKLAAARFSIVDDYISKPLTQEAILRVVDRLCGR